MLQLVITHPAHAEQRIVLTEAEYVIGREASAPIALNEKKVSRKHARIYRAGDAYYVEDLNSVNGVLVGGEAISGPRKLNPGLELDIGGFAIRVMAEAAAMADQFSLRGRTAPVTGKRFSLPMGELEVGRTDDNAIVLADVSVSRTHAILIVSPHRVVVEDKGSSNGTFVNGTRVDRQPLESGDAVKFGSVELTFEVEQSEVSSAGVRDVVANLRTAERPVKFAAIVGVVALALIAVVATAYWLKHRADSMQLDGVSLAQAAYERSINVDLARADELAHREAWEEALAAYDSVLDRDPVNELALSGRSAAREGQLHASLLGQAQAATKENRARDALALLARIPLTSAYTTQAETLRTTLRRTAATGALQKASALCAQRQWLDCHKAAIEHLGMQPSSVEGQQLVTNAESGMKARKIAFEPWSRQLNNSRGQSLLELYGDPAVREAVTTYVAGNIEGAIVAAKAAGARPGASSLAARLEELRKARATAEQAAQAGSSTTAIAGWEQALAHDAIILPAGFALSAPRRQIEQSLADELYRAGSAAMKRGQQKEAFGHWDKGLRLVPGHTQLKEGLAQLDRAAAGVLASVTPGDKSAAACARLQGVLTFTQVDSPHQRAARARLAACPK